MQPKVWIVIAAIVLIVGAGWYASVRGHGVATPEVTTATPSNAATTTQWGNDGEEGGTPAPSAALAAVQASVLGTWQSTDDTQFTREFDRGGIAKDSYKGAVVSTGTWATFTSQKPLDTPFTLEPGVVYLQMSMQGSQAPVLNFKVVKITPDELQLLYVDHGNILSFRRIP